VEVLGGGAFFNGFVEDGEGVLGRSWGGDVGRGGGVGHCGLLVWLYELG